MPEGEMYERMALLERMTTKELDESIERSAMDSLGAKNNADLIAQIVGLKAQLQEKERVIEDLKSVLKVYMDFLEALNPDAKAFDKAMKKIQKK